LRSAPVWTVVKEASSRPAVEACTSKLRGVSSSFTARGSSATWSIVHASWRGSATTTNWLAFWPVAVCQPWFAARLKSSANAGPVVLLVWLE
jgi:hypothetical protein